jgi:hypothetical protein
MKLAPVVTLTECGSAQELLNIFSCEHAAANFRAQQISLRSVNAGKEIEPRLRENRNGEEARGVE